MTSKLCDAADWFRPRIPEIIANDLREVPRFHRKQWESAMIIDTLRELAKLNPDQVGLSMGGGKELVLYAIAQHVKQLVVTDLYDMHTEWGCAKTDDPDTFIRSNKPFHVDDTKLKVLRMDMRNLEFPDQSFDFCYSTCAVEHIGKREDFLQHFNEVARVLKDDGVYVFTTEVGYDATTIKDPHNYVFSLRELYDIFSSSALTPEYQFDARISKHKINYPVQSNLANLNHFNPALFAEGYFRESPHIQLMRGKHPFTCGIFVMRKKTEPLHSDRTLFVGLDESRRFVESGVEQYAQLLNNCSVRIDPFSSLPGEVSRFFTDHVEFFDQDRKARLDPETLFHSDYFWFGRGKRLFDVTLEGPGDTTAESEIELRVHRFRTLSSQEVDCPVRISMRVPGLSSLTETIQIDTDEENSYAILAKVRRGPGLVSSIEITSYPEHLRPRKPLGAPDLLNVFKELTSA